MNIDLAWGVTREHAFAGLNAWHMGLGDCTRFLADLKKMEEFFLTSFSLDHSVLLDPKNAKIVPSIHEMRAKIAAEAANKLAGK
jgi:hypothetical protein